MGTHGVIDKGRMVHALWDEQPGLYRGFIVDAATAVILGFILVVGGRQHTQAAAWGVVNANGGPLIWGFVLIGGGVLLSLCGFGPPRLVSTVLWALALYYVVLGLAWGVAVYHDPDHGASYFGVALVARAAFMHCSRAAVYWSARWTD